MMDTTFTLRLSELIDYAEKKKYGSDKKTLEDFQTSAFAGCEDSYDILIEGNIKILHSGPTPVPYGETTTNLPESFDIEDISIDSVYFDNNGRADHLELDLIKKGILRTIEDLSGSFIVSNIEDFFEF
jgi:hypothetical protein